MKMPKALKEKWIEALRSGEYKQGTGALEKNGKYCCLGVLEMVADGKVERAHEIDGGEALAMPTAEWCAQHGISGAWFGKLDAGTLANRNDRGVPFKAIAKQIEEGVEDYEATDLP